MFTARSRPARPRPLGPIDALEPRCLMTIVPGQVYQDVSWTDADGDTVRVSVTGPVANPATSGFQIDLAGLAANDADASKITLLGLGKDNGVQVVVTPNELPNAGPAFNKIYSGAYTNVTTLTADSTVGSPTRVTALGGIQLSAAIVHSIALTGVDIGNITLDPGQAPYIDRINTTNNQQSLDSTMYKPVTGGIDFGGIRAGSIDTLVINGAISAVTGNPYDLSVTNDFRSVIEVSGRIGTVLGLRSNMAAALRADSIGSVRVAAISGEITTRNATEPFAINMPSTFNGFINIAGHLNIGFPLGDGSLITGQINAGGGISGSTRESTIDPLYLPGTFAGSLSNSSASVGIADLNVDGIATITLDSASSIGNLTADGFGGGFLAEAGTSIGDVTASNGLLGGHFEAGTNLGNLKGVRGIDANLKVGGNIGTLTTVEGALESLSIQAGGNIGAITPYLGMQSTSIVAGGDIGPITIAVGGIELSAIRARDIGAIKLVDGGMESVSLVADRDLGPITVFGSIQEFGLSDVSLVAGRNIGAIDARTHVGPAMEQVKIEAGGTIASLTAISYGEFGELDGAGIFDSNVVAAAIGPVVGRSVGGRGIDTSRFITRNGTGSITSVTGLGWLDGLYNTVVVAHQNLGSITGISLVQGDGISGGSYDANYGTIGAVRGEGGADQGYGLFNTRIQAATPNVGQIASLDATANANGFDAINTAKIYGSTLGPISATVHGGVDGNGVVASEFQAFLGAIGNVNVNTRSINGSSVQDSTFKAATNFGSISLRGAITGSEFRVTGPVVKPTPTPIIIRSVALASVPTAVATAAATPARAPFGRVAIDATGPIDLTFASIGPVGDLSFNNAPAGTTVRLNLEGTSVGNVRVGGSGANLDLRATTPQIGNVSAPGSLNLVAPATVTIGDVTVGGNATLSTGGLRTLGNLSVQGMLGLPQGLASLTRAGNFAAGSLPAMTGTVAIGSKTNAGSSIGTVQIGSIGRGRGQYQFTFQTFAGAPAALIGGRSVAPRGGNGVAVNGARLVLAPAARPTVTRTVARRAIAR